MQDVEYVFRIDAFTPENLPMARLAEYLGALAKLIGHKDHTHFVSIERGSAQLVHRVEHIDAPKVDARLTRVRLGDASKEALKARRELDDLLANDNAVGTLTERVSGKVILPFPGRMRPKPIAIPPFRENATIQGQVVRVGGTDNTAHAILQDGETSHTNLSMSREIAKQLAHRLYGPMVRLHGNGRFERQEDGEWRVLDFRVDRFEELNDQPIDHDLRSLREIRGNGLMREDAYWAGRKLVDDEESSN